MKIVKIKPYGVMLIITGILFGSLLYPGDINATILSGIDEPTGNAYEDVYIAEEENATITSGSNQTTMNTNSTTIQ
jgi:hypothetical protein